MANLLFLQSLNLPVKLIFLPFQLLFLDKFIHGFDIYFLMK